MIEKLKNLKSKPIDIPKEVWDQHLNKMRCITLGIRRTLPKNRTKQEVVDELVQDTLVYLLGHEERLRLRRKDWPAEKLYYWTGARIATYWLRKNFIKGKTSITPLFSDLDTTYDEGPGLPLQFSSHIRFDRLLRVSAGLQRIAQLSSVGV